MSYLCSTVHVAHAHRARGYRWADDPAAREAMKKKVPETVGACFDLIERKMFRGPWAMGDAYTIADPYLFTIARWMEVDSVDPAAFPACSTTATGWPSARLSNARSRAKDWRSRERAGACAVLAPRLPYQAVRRRNLSRFPHRPPARLPARARFREEHGSGREVAETTPRRAERERSMSRPWRGLRAGSTHDSDQEI